MGNFCTKCGNKLDEVNGLCPVCDIDQIEGNPFAELEKDLMKDMRKNKAKASTTVISVVLSVVLFITLFLGMTIYFVRSSLDKKSIKNYLEDIVVTDFLYNTGIASDAEFDKFYETAYEVCGAEIDENQLNEFIDESSVEDFFVSKFSGFFDDFFEGNAELEVRRDEIVDLIEDNTMEIRDCFGVVLDNSQVSEMADYFCKEGEVIYIDTESFEDSFDGIYQIISICFSTYTMIFLFVISMIIMGLMFFNSITQALSCIGIDFIIYGGFFILLISLIQLFNSILEESFIMTFLNFFAQENTFIFIIFIIVGIAFLCSAKILNKKRMKKFI